MDSTSVFERPPRIQPTLVQKKVELPAPPEPTSEGEFSFSDFLLPLITIGGYLLMALFGQGRNLILMVPMTGAMFLSIYLSYRRMTQAKGEYQKRLKEYHQQLGLYRDQLRQQHQSQRDYYFYNYPDARQSDTIMRFEGVSRMGLRLWERRTEDDDFGMFRLGIGTRPSTFEYTLGSNDSTASLSLREAQRLVADSLYLTDAPITLLMRRKYSTEAEKTSNDPYPIRSTLAIAQRQPPESDPLKDPSYQYTVGLLMQYAAMHSPTEASLYVIGSEAARPRWKWARGLPHAKTTRGDPLVCFEGDTITNNERQRVDRLPVFWKDLRVLLQSRQQRLADKEAGDVTLPFLLVVVDLYNLKPNSPLESIAVQEFISLIIHQGESLGAALIFIADPTVSSRPKPVVPGNLVPDGVRAVVEITSEIGETLTVRYSESGFNSQRMLGVADPFYVPGSNAANLTELAQKYLSRISIRTSASRSLASALDLLQLHGVEKASALDILNNWDSSLTKGEWPRVAIGVRSGGENRELQFSADADGVHGMIAGTTGSGKSELLLTLIVGLAMRYDPRIVNFVLVDFKGGAAFEEFRRLPHCVDIVTNLEGNAVDRMFSAIKAELDRRSEMLKDYKVKHIVEYRKKKYHLQDPDPADFKDRQKDPPKQQPFPHLFIIVDEFAEMVVTNPEYKAQFDSITRLGRAIGVSLILATQKPAGMVTDQMRANMKFKICLRVESPEDSRELLRRADAAYLPAGIPGRAYIQIGNEIPELIQVARAGSPYQEEIDVSTDTAQDELPSVIWLRSPREQIENTEGDNKNTLSEVLVKDMADKAQGKSIPAQDKPWPDPLPVYLPASVAMRHVPFFSLRHLEDDLPNEQSGPIEDYILNPALERWLREDDYNWDMMGQGEDKRLAFSWARHGGRVTVGVIDHPRAAEQRPLRIDLRRGNVAVFGASGWGKSTFLHTLIVGLAAIHSPEQLHAYILDFGGRTLNSYQDLPHVGAVIVPEERERFRRLIRYLNNTIIERNVVFTRVGVRDFIDYNVRASEERSKSSVLPVLPAILVVIDNFAEVRENYENYLDILLGLLRDGRNVGVYFAVSADVPGAMTGKIYNQFFQKIALRMIDKNEYVAIVGRSTVGVPEINGRGLVAVERKISPEPLEVQIALPIALSAQDIIGLKQVEGEQIPQDWELDAAKQKIVTERILTEVRQKFDERLKALINEMKRAHESYKHGSAPQKMEILPPYVALTDVLEHDAAKHLETSDDASAFVGIRDDNLQPLKLDLRNYPHFIVVGPPLSGRTTFLRTWIYALSRRYAPHEAAFVIIDPQERFMTKPWEEFDQLPHRLDVVMETKQLDPMVKALEFEYNFPRPQSESEGQQTALQYIRIADTLVRRAQFACDRLQAEIDALDNELKALAQQVPQLQADQNNEAKLQAFERQRSELNGKRTGAFQKLEKAKRQLDKAQKEQRELNDLLLTAESRDKAGDENAAEGMSNGAEPQYRWPKSKERPQIFIFIDNFDDFEDLVPTGAEAALKTLSDLARNYRRDGLHFILCGSEEVLRNASNPLRRTVWQSRHAFALREAAFLDRLNARKPPEVTEAELLVGRGFLVQSGLVNVAQIATLEADRSGRDPKAIAGLVQKVKKAHPEPISWLYNQTNPLLRSLYEQSQAEDFTLEEERPTGALIDYEAQKQANNRHPHRLLLTGANLLKLNLDLLLEIGVFEGDNEQTFPKDTFHLNTAESLNRQIYGYNDVGGGALALPAAISDEHLKRIKARIAVYDLLDAKTLQVLPASIMEDLALDQAQMKSKDIGALQLALRKGDISLPTEVKPDVAAKIESFKEIRSLLTAANLLMLAPELLAKLDLTYYDQPLKALDVFGKKEDQVNAALKEGQLVLPLTLPADLIQEVRSETSKNVAGNLFPDLLAVLPAVVWQRLGITGEVEQAVGASPEKIHEMLNTGRLSLPKELTKEMKAEIRKHQKAIPQKVSPA